MVGRWFQRKPRGNAPALPEGMRAYAIGDVHGRADLLDPLLDAIFADDAARPTAQTHLIFLGDLIDRGPDSAGVVRRVRELAAAREHVSLVTGNHEEILLEALEGSSSAARRLLEMGGYATLESYGIARDAADAGGFDDLIALMARHVPAADVRMLRAGRSMVRHGDYLFVHAGIRPGVPLDRQVTADLHWIREPFLSRTRGDGLVVVHGHTPVAEADIRPGRINVDTGAFRSNLLTAVGIEGGATWLVQHRG